MRQIGPQKQGETMNQQKPMKPVMQTKQPATQMAGGQVVEKKSKWWLWVIIALVVLIGVAAAVYFLFLR